jgi:hypothetical protein
MTTSSSSLGPRVCFVSASGQNAFFEELLEAFRKPLEASGIRTESSIDHFPPLADDLVYIFVPHEYVALTMPSAHPTSGQLRRSVVIATEQPGTHWFEESTEVAVGAGATLDIQTLGVEELRRRGVRARFLPLGYVPEWDMWHGADTPRPIDATFLGGYTDRRALLLARCASVLSNYRASIRLVENWRPHTADDSFFLSGAPKFQHLAASKIVFSAHRKPYAYLEWQRALGAIANGCVVLTEHSSGFAPLIPGEHFVSTSFDTLPVALAGLLEDDSYVASVRSAAYDFVRNEMPLTKSVAVLADAIDDVSKLTLVGNGSRGRPMPAPRPPSMPVPEWKQIETEPSETRAIAASIKRLAQGQRRLELRLTELVAADGREAVAVRRFGPQTSRAVRITVAVSLFNYADTVGEAIASVGLAADNDVELVIVDDGSTDDSVQVVEKILTEELPWLRATLLSRSQNAGLPAARNLAIEKAAGEYVFILDADNLVYPHAFSRLAEALEKDTEAAFAYGMLERFNNRGPAGLMSWGPWQVSRFAWGNYIDAMALVRRSALERAGGYPTDERIYGWEDFALWCRLAELGLHGVQVPEILGRYRASAYSMISLTNIDSADSWAYLLERFPFLREQAE